MPITSFELCRLLKEEIDGESEPIRYTYGAKSQNTKQSTRAQNGLATLAQVSKILSLEYQWLKPFGDHLDHSYGKARHRIKIIPVQWKSFASVYLPLF
jgi:hypothetical protein